VPDSRRPARGVRGLLRSAPGGLTFQEPSCSRAPIHRYRTSATPGSSWPSRPPPSARSR